MTSKKILGLLIGASLLIGYEPVAVAMPAAAPGSAVGISKSDGHIVQVVVVRTTRRVRRR